MSKQNSQQDTDIIWERYYNMRGYADWMLSRGHITQEQYDACLEEVGRERDNIVAADILEEVDIF